MALKSMPQLAKFYPNFAGKMRFIVDECTGPSVAAWLRDQNYDVFSVFEDSRGMNDDDIIKQAVGINGSRKSDR